VKGYIGPWSPTGAALGEESASGIRYLGDPRVVDGTAWITGANADGKHVFGLVAGRDFAFDGTVEIAEVRAGDPAPDGSGPVELARGMEIGHVFQLGRKYAEALDLKVLDENGKLVTVTMGSYGIGVTRILAAIAEATADERGLLWPRGIAPFDVHVVATGKDEVAFELGAQLASELEAERFEVLYDDRPKVSPGVKFGDAELLGVPTVVIVGRGAADGLVELWDRRTNERTEVPASELVARFRASLT
jgi:prolyl-tRNA synthetase